MTQQTQPTPGAWFPDPEQPGQMRYWDGATWTEQRRPAAQPPFTSATVTAGATAGAEPATKTKPWWRATWAVGVAALLVGLVVGGAAVGGGDSSPAAAGSAAATVTATETVTTIPDAVPTDSSDDNASDTAADTAPAVPKPADFKIKLKIRQKECFGSAGCNITFQIDPAYLGTADVNSGSYDVTYKVLGGEDGPQINTFTIEDGQASFDQEETISTSSTGSRLRAKVTDVSSNDCC